MDGWVTPAPAPAPAPARYPRLGFTETSEGRMDIPILRTPALPPAQLPGSLTLRELPSTWSNIRLSSNNATSLLVPSIWAEDRWIRESGSRLLILTDSPYPPYPSLSAPIQLI